MVFRENRIGKGKGKCMRDSLVPKNCDQGVTHDSKNPILSSILPKRAAQGFVGRKGKGCLTESEITRKRPAGVGFD